jgi:hypothetical protein
LNLLELKQQAGIQDNPDQEGLDLFAELLIQQCMACSTWVGKMNTNSVEPVHTAHAINQRIKQQFGVEE